MEIPTMKLAQIIHNPGSGDAEHNKDSLIASVEKSGYKTHYISTLNPMWEASLDTNADMHIVAGGDGTVRKLAVKFLQESQEHRQKPMLLLPLGTANNITRSLGTDHFSIEQQMKLENVNDYDCGSISGLEKYDFFIESMGAGIFPELIVKMDEESREFDSAEEELKYTYKVLKDLVRTYEPAELSLEIDEITMKGRFLMAELMNIRFLGPNIELAPKASSADSFLDLVLIHESSRDELLKYIESVENESPQHDILENIAQVYPAKNVSFINHNEKLHVDDHIVENPGARVNAEVSPGVFKVFSEV